MDQEDRDAVAEELIAKCDAILHLAFETIAFEMGYNGEKYELILTPEGDRTRLFELVYFQRQDVYKRQAAEGAEERGGTVQGRAAGLSGGFAAVPFGAGPGPVYVFLRPAVFFLSPDDQ